MSVDLPRFVVAAPASGHGKTTVATGLMLALRRAGLRVSGHKVGPDYIDPGYHALATGRPGRNLDPHLVGEDRIVPLLLHGAAEAGPSSAPAPGPADVAVIEGVMGLYDGHIGGDGFASTAHVSTLTSSPVILVVDISHASRSIAAVVLGMATFHPDVRIAGVILNKAGSQRHSDEVRRALQPLGIPVLGVLHRDDDVSAPSRHLGLVPVAERPEAARSLEHLADKVASSIDLDAVMRIARSASPLVGAPWDVRAALPGVDGGDDDNGRQPLGGVLSLNGFDRARPVVAVAGGRAFTFRYTETVELLEAAGCEVEVFDPTADEALPAGTSGIYLGGGFPEVHAAELSANAPLRESLRSAIAEGVPTVAECAGLLYLCRTVDGAPMVGAIPADAAMAPRLTLAYRRSTAPADSMLAAAGTEVTGHEFHRTAVTPAAGGSGASGASGDLGAAAPAAVAAPAWTSAAGPEGFAGPTLHASYLHTHWAGHPALAARFATHVHHFAGATPRLQDTPTR